MRSEAGKYKTAFVDMGGDFNKGLMEAEIC